DIAVHGVSAEFDTLRHADREIDLDVVVVGAHIDIVPWSTANIRRPAVAVRIHGANHHAAFERHDLNLDLGRIVRLARLLHGDAGFVIGRPHGVDGADHTPNLNLLAGREL